MKRGVSLYGYQQTQFLKELDLEGQIREVSENLGGADGIEIVDEMSLRYPDPGEEFVGQWFGWMEKYGTVPVTMDVCMDVLQFRDHVMSIEECGQRLVRDLHLARRLGFANVRVLSTTPLDVMLYALPTAEDLDIRLGKEIHQPMPLEGQQVAEIVEHVQKTGTHHLGLVPDFGIFQVRPSEVLLEWFVRQGAHPEACDASARLADLLAKGQAPFGFIDMSFHSAGNVRKDFNTFISDGSVQPEFADTFHGVRKYVQEHVPEPADIDYRVVAEALMLSNTDPDLLRQMADLVVSVHAKFYNMSPVPGEPDQFQDIAIDYPSGIAALKAGGYQGYVNSEYEGQRYFQDRTRADLMSEIDQVRRHQTMLRRLLGE
jgi:sugar phosphate isomerase/epimerase